VGLSFILSAAIVLVACRKSSFDNNSNQQAAGLMAFNLAPGKAAVVKIGSNTLPGSPLAFNSYTGGYLPIYPGNRVVESIDYASGASLASVSGSFAVGKYYSVFLVGTGNSFQNVLSQDNFDSLSAGSGQSYIRYINAIPGSTSPTVTINSNGTSVVSTAAPFAGLSGFIPVTPGALDISVNEGTTFHIARTISTEAKRVYTILLIPGATSSDTAQIRFVLNGTLDNNSAGQ
jgi:hypothetical protein